ncbi:transporter substrate-binding domain-containing protein [Pseudomonas sp. PDM17]|uniref:substrate-binding periplasmic protein n=1 Tax=Pseudomonas sp. PDM17 TaxID=2769285 RepID=UPI0017848583|nr:transporter substrate-binding domain-containing protein [Pseudomonas sp. PDM17]MBD9504486.1 transporter substrate-binding domain-containing protein [Pseudomonas sp. PDM17]
MFRIGCDPDNPPYTKLSAGVWSGTEYEFITSLLYETRLEFEIVPVSWGDMFDQLRLGKVAAIFSSLSATEERRQEFLFSDAYFDSPETLMGWEGVNLESIELGRCSLAVLAGSNHERYARASFPGADIRLFSNSVEMLNALESATVDTVVSELNAAQHWLHGQGKREKIRVLGEPIICPEIFGNGSSAAVGRSFPELRDCINTALRGTPGQASAGLGCVVEDGLGAQVID